jgi:hypothetical protein
MHCPSCGQQQISNETKFCSRCGLPLSIVSEVVMHGGYLPQLAAINNKPTLFTRRNGVAFSVLWCLFFLLIMAPLWAIMNVDELAAASAVIGIFGGLIWMISSLMFLKKVPNVNVSPNFQQAPPPSGLYGQPQYNALPQGQSIPASSYGPPRAGNWRDTNDLQPNVSESATKLLNEDER